MWSPPTVSSEVIRAWSLKFPLVVSQMLDER